MPVSHNNHPEGLEKLTTMKDIARDLNISVSSVARALNNKGRISEETKQRILKRAKELNYRPNTIAKRMALRKKFKIAVIMPDEPVYYWNDVRAGLDEVRNELEHFNVQIILLTFKPLYIKVDFGVFDKVKEIEPDGIVMAPLDLQEKNSLIEYCEKKDIPLVLFNDNAITSNSLFYYGPDKKFTGRIAGELMGKFMGQKGELCLIVKSKRIYTVSQRIEGFYEEISSRFPQIKILDTYTYNEGKEEEALKDLLQQYTSMTGFYIVTGGWSGRFGTLLKEQGRKDLVVVGHEVSEQSGEMLIEGYIDALVCEEKKTQGYYPVKMLYEYLTGDFNDLRDEIYSDVNIILRSNLSSARAAPDNPKR